MNEGICRDCGHYCEQYERDGKLVRTCACQDKSDLAIYIDYEAERRAILIKARQNRNRIRKSR